MNKVVRRVLLPLVAICVLILLYLLPSTSKIYETGNAIADSIGQYSQSTPAKVEPSSLEKVQLPEVKLEEPEKELDPCTVVNPMNHQFIDLQSLSLSDEGNPLRWTSKSFDKKRNYTLGICTHPSKGSQKFDNLDPLSVGGYYVENGTYLSIGQYSKKPRFEGKKIILTYENGSYCDSLVDSKTGQPLRKSSIITFTCDREMLAKASIQFVAEANDCTYFFEVRSHHACPTAQKANNMAAIWIFLLIVFAAFSVYFSGGLLYKHLKVKS